MADQYPVLEKNGDRQRVGISAPYYRELLEKGYVEETAPSPVDPSPPEDNDTEEVDE